MSKIPNYRQLIREELQRLQRKGPAPLTPSRPSALGGISTPAPSSPVVSTDDLREGEGTLFYTEERAISAGYYATETGTDAYAITTGMSLTELTVGQQFRLLLDVGNTDGATLQVDGLPASPAALLKRHDQAMTTGDLEAGQLILVAWDGTAWQLLSALASTPSGTGDVAGDIHAAKAKLSLANDDELGIVDSAASWILKKVSWFNIKVALVTAFDALYAAIDHTHAQLHDRQHSITSASDHTFPGNAAVYLDGTGAYSTPAGSGAGDAAGPNLLINGGFDFFQRQVPGTATNRADDAYGPDRWYVLAQSGIVNVERYQLALSSKNGVRLTQMNAAAQRFGLAQIIESANATAASSDTVTFQGKVLCSASTNIKMAILQWSGSADTVTSDVVNDWTSGTFTVGNFFINPGNIIAVHVGTQAVTAGSLATFTLTANLAAAHDNLIAVIWTEDALAQNATLRLSECDLFVGDAARAWAPRQIGEELRLCQRYYYTTYPIDASPAEPTGDHMRFKGTAVNTSNLRVSLPFPTPMRAAPVITFLRNYSGTAARWAYYTSGGTFATPTSTSDVITTAVAVEVDLTHASQFTFGQSRDVTGNLQASAEL